MDASLQEILSRPGTLTFPSNLADAPRLSTSSASFLRLPTGHLVVYGSHGRRILATDPEGYPLHECEWESVDGKLRLLRSRVHLDWGAWVGLTPGGLVNTMTLDLSRKPGWQRLRADDLRGMAAQAMRVPLEEVRFFYSDQDMTIDAKGSATIRHRKDAIYYLPDGTFDTQQFMACMGAMHWERIDFLPVVELFLSLLPGTGSALFELIRGLYDDQNRGQASPRPLRYRGIPTYPSEAAYRLFSNFFSPHLTGGGDPFPVFMDAPRSHLVTWTPVPDPPRRHVNLTQKLCVTIQGQRMLKATRLDDPAGLSYQPFDQRGLAPCQRGLMIRQGQLLLTEGDMTRAIPLPDDWGRVDGPATPGAPLPALEWQSVFGGSPPQVDPKAAFGAVLLYPNDEQEIGELATQPFVSDYLQDLIEQDRPLAAKVSRAEQVLISGFDAAITTCFAGDRSRAYTVRYDHAAYAQRQAQMWWNLLARAQRLEWLTRVRMRPHGAGEEGSEFYDLVYEWTPFNLYDKPEAISHRVQQLARHLSPGALAFIVGPPAVADMCRTAGVHLQAITPVASLPTFRMHQSVLPRAQLKPGIMLYQIVGPSIDGLISDARSRSKG
ncbi:MAG TPA: hypothetical protein PK866_02430 [Nitrospira sp.]|nr:hypothetical protein [Nitrospira sp.]